MAGEILFLDATVLLTATGSLRPGHRQAHRLFEEPAEVATRLRELVAAHRIRGKAVHDAGIVATMQAHGIRHAIPENGKDFARFAGITTLSIGETVSDPST